MPTRHDEILADIARFAGSSLDLDQVLERIVLRAAELTGADRSSIWLLDPTGTTLLPSALFGMSAEFTAGWKTRPLALADEPLSREAVQLRRPVVVLDAEHDPRTDKASVSFFGDRSILVVPLVRLDRIQGTLFLNHVQRRYAFTTADVETTTAIASQAAIAIDNARLYRDTRQLVGQLWTSFRYAGEALASADNVQQTLQSMVQLAVETVGAAGGSISLLDETGRSTYLVASSGDLGQADSGAAEFPLATPERPLGVLALWRPQLPFTADERELLASFAGHARTAIEHARLYASLQEERERAHAAERAQAEFTSMISHELRTPLALIQGYVSTLLRPGMGLTEETAHRFLEGISQACERLRKLIDNLLSTTALEQGGFPTNPQTVDVSDLLGRASAEAAVIADSRRIDLSSPDGANLVLGDADQLHQVFLNLLHNASKYAPGETPIEASVTRADGRVVVSVRDHGPGIPDDALGHVFEKFYRVAAPPDPPATGGDAGPSAPRPSGMGLGLYICRRIVEAHGGRIWAENVPEGGAAFIVQLPAVLQASAGTMGSGAAPEQGTAGPQRAASRLARGD